MEIGESSNGRSSPIGETEKIRCFYVEYDPLSVKIRMGRMFCRDFYYSVLNIVNLCDPIGNKFDIFVKRVFKTRRLYIVDGWHQIATLYNLHRGGWVKFYYLGSSKFTINVYDRKMVEVDYRHGCNTNDLVWNPVTQPSHDTSHDNVLFGEDGLDENIGDNGTVLDVGDNGAYLDNSDNGGVLDVGDNGGVLDDGDNGVVLDVGDNGVVLDNGDNFDYSVQKTLKAYEVTSSKLLLNVAFCSIALSTKRSRCVLVSESGDQWPARIIWVKRSRNKCYLGAGWLSFARHRGLNDGTVITLGVRRNEPDKIYVNVVV